MKKTITLLIALIFTSGFLYAQSKKIINAKVVDESGAPLIGANVYLTLEKVATAVDLNGNFSITSNNPANEVRITFVGYKTLQLNLKDVKNIITMEKDNQNNLNEVVVVGYGTSTKKDLTGAVSTLSGSLIEERKATRLSQALQGAVPGVSVTRKSGTPGTAGTILIRGVTTLGVNDPLVIVDGIPGAIDNVTPDEVESISVLKDAASSAIYGSRAAAGVILITTKRAKDGQTDITYNAEFGIEKATAMPEFVDAPTYMRLYNDLKVNDGATPIYDPATIANYAALNAQNPDKYPNTDWQKSYFKNSAFQQKHTLDLSVGGKNVKTKVVAGYLNQAALEPNRSFNRYSIRVNNDLVFNNKLTANVDIGYYRTESLSATTSDISFVRQLNPTYDDYYSDGRYAPGKDGTNPVANNDLGGRTNSRNNQFTAKLQVNFDPFKGLTLTGIVAPQLGFTNSSAFSQIVKYTSLTDPTVTVSTFNNTNSLTQSQAYSQVINSQFLINYKTVIRNDHNIKFLLGYEDNTFHDESSGAFRDGFLLPNYQVLNAGATINATNSGTANESALRSFFSRFDYNYKNKYLLSASARYDGSSRFSANNRWGFFPAVSAAWVLTEENFLKNKSPFSYLKIRGSLGRNGNQQIGNYSYQSLINLNQVLFYNSSGNIVPATAGNQLNYAVKDITWETKQDYDLGLDMSFLNSRLSVGLDYFKKTTFDILLNLPIPLNTGLLATPQNGGKLNNEGYEIQIGWNDRIGEDWKYRFSINLSDFTNRIIDLKGTSTLGSQAIIEGQPYNVWYGYESLGYFKDAADVAASPKLTGNEKPGDIKYADLNGDGKISADKDQIPLANSLPRYLFGGSANIQYKNIDFGFSFQGIGKQTALQTSNLYTVQPFAGNFGNVNTYLLNNYWTPDNPNAKYPRLTYNNVNVNYATSSFWLYNNAYLRIKDITLGYTFSSAILHQLGIKRARIFVSGTDVLTFSHQLKGWDPETTQSSNPIVATYFTGLSVTF